MTREAQDRQAMHWQAAACLLTALAWLACLAWYRPFTSPDEGRYAGVAYAMLQSGDWIVPRLNGLPFFHKPPLFYWLGAGAMAVFGHHEWAARTPSIIGAMLSAGSLFVFLRRHVSFNSARLTVVILCTFPFFYLGAQFANLDMLVAGCISMTILAAADAVLAGERGQPWRSALAVAFIGAAMGLLAKGLIGLLLPGLVIVLWVLVSLRPGALRLAVWLPGWCLLLAIAGPWFVIMQARFPQFFDYFVITQHFRRFASSGFNNEHPFWFYVPVLLALCLPWSGWLARWLRRRESATSGRTGREIDLLMGIWLFVIVAFFSLPRSKLIGYILPALPPFAALIGGRLRLHSGSPPASGASSMKWTMAGAALTCLACVGIAARFGTPPDATLRLPAGERISPGDRVVMLDSYFYQLPFYWRLSGPVVIAADWKPSVALASDNWRKEMADAATFDPVAGSTLLQQIETEPAAICAGSRTWVIGASNAQLAAPWVLGMKLVTYNPKMAVWRYDSPPGAGPGCLGATASPAVLQPGGRAG